MIRTFAMLAGACVAVRIVANLFYNRRFSAQPAPVRRLNRRHL